ncbi:c-type cytochrome [Vicingaceae bacterium]|nr:c-type cytochrome [Vicingaceae bacterium]MDC1451762.1 c-type cytochrome [Vicingaceae bacterium]
MNVISFKKPTNIFLGLFSFLLAMSLSSTTLQAQEDGEKLFKSYCASCHSPGANQLVGPGLAGVYDKYEREWLYKWIKNSSALIATGDAQAISVYEQYNKVIMPAQPVTNVQIDAILDYLKVYAEAAPVVAVVVPPTVVVEDEGMSGYAIAGIVVLFLILIILLRKVQYIFTAAKAREAGEDMPEETTMTQALGLTISQNKTIFALMGIVCLALFAKGGWDSAFGVGVYQGYEPEQPIKFSHELHAGTNGIDCNYCHNSASYSKSAGIPSPNLCMNCHTYIQEGPQYGKEEIGKIYAALDFDPVTKTYGPNQKPIKWVKVHNLPDHVYFNHSQHVAIGKIACEKCHGPVETYTVGKQYAELTMGWCINCHRETKVQMADNGYYDEIHNRLPEELKKQYLEDGTITVSELGGIECAKCHY